MSTNFSAKKRAAAAKGSVNVSALNRKRAASPARSPAKGSVNVSAQKRKKNSWFGSPSVSPEPKKVSVNMSAIKRQQEAAERERRRAQEAADLARLRAILDARDRSAQAARQQAALQQQMRDAQAAADAAAHHRIQEQSFLYQGSMNIDAMRRAAEQKKNNEWPIMSGLWWTLMSILTFVSHDSEKNPRSEWLQAFLLFCPTLSVLWFVFKCTDPETYAEICFGVYVFAKFLIGCFWLMSTDGAGVSLPFLQSQQRIVLFT